MSRSDASLLSGNHDDRSRSSPVPLGHACENPTVSDCADGHAGAAGLPAWPTMGGADPRSYLRLSTPIAAKTVTTLENDVRLTITHVSIELWKAEK
jgi:hypothetical protein